MTRPELFQSDSDIGEYLFRITDNGGATADRYMVLFSDGDALALSGGPSHPQGVSMWAENVDPAALQENVEEGREVDLGWHDLPEHIRRHVRARLNEAWADYLAHLERYPPVDWLHAEENDGTHRSAGVGIYVSAGRFFVKLDGDQAGDRGPFATMREALLATLPDHYSLSGPEYHSTATGGATDDGEPCPTVASNVAALEARVGEALAES